MVIVGEGFDKMEDKEIVQFVSENSEQFALDFDPNFSENTISAIGRSHVSIEKRKHGFAIVGHENREAVSALPVFYAPPFRANHLVHDESKTWPRRCRITI
jgi:hypothetical protein